MDDNAFLNLRTAERARPPGCKSPARNGRTSFPLRSTVATGKLHIEGLGGSYGVERLTYYRMLPEMGPPETTIWEYPRGDEFLAHRNGRISSKTSACNVRPRPD